MSIHPYFKVNEGKMDEFKALLPEFVERTSKEVKCLYYDFSIMDGEVIHCREAYIGAEGVLAHLENVGDLLEKGLGLSELLRLEFHGPAEEIAKLKEPLKDLNPHWYEFQCGVPAK